MKMQHLRPHLQPTEPESAFSQDSQGLYAHFILISTRIGIVHIEFQWQYMYGILSTVSSPRLCSVFLICFKLIFENSISFL